MPVRRLAFLMFSLLFALSLVACGGGEGEEDGGEGGEEDGQIDSFTLGFVPSVEAGNMAEEAEPLAEALGEELDAEVEAEVLTNYIGLVEAMGNEQVDIGFLNSFGYVLAKDRYPGVEPLFKAVRFGSATYRGQFVTQADSGIEELSDLEGEDVAFVDPASTSGYLFPMNTLVQEGLIETGSEPESFFGETVFAGGHDSALVALYNDEVDAAVSFEDARGDLEEEYPDVMDELTVIEYTEEIPNDTVSVRGGLDEETVNRISEALLAVNESEEGSALLEEIYEWDDMEPAEDEEYDVIRDTAEALELDLQETAEQE